LTSCIEVRLEIADQGLKVVCEFAEAQNVSTPGRQAAGQPIPTVRPGLVFLAECGDEFEGHRF